MINGSANAVKLILYPLLVIAGDWKCAIKNSLIRGVVYLLNN
jgi:hypothetical protein